MSHLDSELFSGNHSDIPEKKCPHCHDLLQIKHSKSGPFLACPNYPSCSYLEPLHQVEPMLEQVLTGSCCPQCQHELAVKKGRYGLFIACTQYPSCDYVADMKPVEESSVICPACKTGHLVQRSSRHGKKFFACDQYPKCNYLVNQQPIAQSCPDCGWGILVEKRSSAGRRYSCPQKNCAYKGRLLD